MGSGIRAVTARPPQSVFWLHDDARGADRRVRLTQRRDYPLASAFGWPQVDEKHLVFVMLDDLRKRVSTAGQVDRCELALEDRVLKVIAEIPHGLTDLAEAFIFANIVTDEIGISHGRGST